MTDRIPGSSYANPLWHRRWRIYPNAHHLAWQVAFVGVHDDFDGADDSNDHRCFYAPTADDVRQEIDEWELSNPERVYDREWCKCADCGGTGEGWNGPLDGTKKFIFCPNCDGYGGWFADSVPTEALL